MIPLLSAVSLNAAIIALTLGIALIALELNRPGLILPGASGLLLALLSAASLARHHPRPWAAFLLLAAAALMLLQLRLALAPYTAIPTSLALIAGFEWLTPLTSPPIHAWTAILCGITLGTGITVLTRIARRARQNKGLD